MIKQPGTAAVLRLRNLMESPARPPSKDYVQYQHTDACSIHRWTARESYEFMFARPWHKINDFYLDAVNGRQSLHQIFGEETNDVDAVDDFDKPEAESVPVKDRTGRWARATFKMLISYNGNSFDGWQKQPGLNTVQGLVESSLGKFVDEKKAQLLKEKKLPLEGCALVAGRTDKGVTALGQVCAFYTWRKDVKALDIEEALKSAAPGKIRVTSVSQVSRDFHPNFSAKWRHYFYIFPFNEEKVGDEIGECKNTYSDKAIFQDEDDEGLGVPNNEDEDDNYGQTQQPGSKPFTFEVSRVNHLLRQLEGNLLSFRMFARDTKASRNVGPPTECFVFHARAAEAYLPSPKKDGVSSKVMCVELVANRFLRKMVRVLVATAIREAAAGAEEDALIKLMDATCRRATAPPAPPDGLCLVDVGYTEFDKKFCIIP